MNDIKATDGLKVGTESIIRTQSAGVHIGTILNRTGTEVELANARRLWGWKGAFTLNEVATRGVNRKESWISTDVPRIILTQVVEIVPVLEGVDLSSTMSTKEIIYDVHSGYGEASGTGNGSGEGNGSGNSSGQGSLLGIGYGSGVDSGYGLYSGSGSFNGSDYCFGSACGAAG
jgi:hypothetical protein